MSQKDRSMALCPWWGLWSLLCTRKYEESGKGTRRYVFHMVYKDIFVTIYILYSFPWWWKFPVPSGNLEITAHVANGYAICSLLVPCILCDPRAKAAGSHSNSSARLVWLTRLEDQSCNTTETWLIQQNSWQWRWFQVVVLIWDNFIVPAKLQDYASISNFPRRELWRHYENKSKEIK